MSSSDVLAVASGDTEEAVLEIAADENTVEVLPDPVLVTDWLSWNDLVPLLHVGDLLEFRRVIYLRNYEQRVYSHWALFIGVIEGIPRVVHSSTPDGDFEAIPLGATDSLPAAHTKLREGSNAEVRTDNLCRVAGNDLVRVNNSSDRLERPFPPRIICQRAFIKLGSKEYHLLLNNCEHFVKWCRYGQYHSTQSAAVASGGLAILALAATGSLPVGATVGLTCYTISLLGAKVVREGRRLLIDAYTRVKRHVFKRSAEHMLQ